MQQLSFFISIGIVILSTMGYHISQKYIEADINPAVVLVVAYIFATVLSAAALLFNPPESGVRGLMEGLTWPVIGLGIAVVGIEIGFLLAYRAGWQVSTAGMVANVATAVFLIPIGFLFFRERLTAVNFAGLVVCVVGLIMVNWTPSN
ncbi:MAG: hypothetical protein AAF490_04480 [Chloroflexota bacterium]